MNGRFPLETATRLSQPVSMFAIRGLALGGATLLAACATLPPPTTVPSVDLSRYAGEWYEVEAFPTWFQRGCTGARATYTPQADGTIRVINTCQRSDRTARINNSKLKVRFFWPFEGDYWILDLDPAYRWAAVGTPNRKYLWILSRTPQLDPALLARIRTRLASQGYDISRLRPATPVPPPDTPRS